MLKPLAVVAQLVAQAHRAAADFIEQTGNEESIDCDFVRLDGYLYPHDSSNSTFRTLEKELQASIGAGTYMRPLLGRRGLHCSNTMWWGGRLIKDLFKMPDALARALVGTHL